MDIPQMDIEHIFHKKIICFIFLNLPVWICQWFDSYNWIHLGIVEHWFRQCEQGCKIPGVNLYNKVRLKVFSIPPKCLYKFNPSGTVFWTCWTHRFVFSTGLHMAHDWFKQMEWLLPWPGSVSWMFFRNCTDAIVEVFIIKARSISCLLKS